MVARNATPERRASFYQDCCCASGGNYATIPNYLEMELRYMDAGSEAQKRQCWASGTPGYQNHVIYHDLDHRYAVAAPDGTDQRRPRYHRAGGGRPDRKPDLSRLRAGLGRLHP